MVSIQVDDVLEGSYYINEIVEYIYDNKHNLIFDENDNENRDNLLKLKLLKFKNTNVKIGLGCGTYKYKFEDAIINISYSEEGKTRGVHSGVKYYNRFILESDKEETLKKFLTECHEKIKKKDIETTSIYITNEYGEWTSYNKIPSRKLNSIYLDEKIKNKLIDDINIFLKSEDDYNKYGIPYKRSYLLTGLPGSGKTSLIKAICNDLDHKLYILSISKKFDNSSLIYAIQTLEEKCILLIEDIDSLFEKRESTNDNPSITFSNLINVLDGVLYRHGTIIFLTTNHPEKLDHALLRIGRVDMILKFEYPSKQNIKNLFYDMLTLDEDEKSKMFEKFYEYVKNEKIAMAALVNFLFRYKNNWEENISELLNTNSFIKTTLKQIKQEGLYM
jgi:SpoVK/Ycf46/Vps4 family AAA+-type ATPase